MPGNIKMPIFRIHENLRSNDGLDIPLHLDPWEIEVQRKNGLAWSIVLAILIQLVDVKKEDFQKEDFRALVHIFGINKESTVDNIRKCIEMYNPFLNNNSCFGILRLKRLVKLFEEKVRKHMKQMQAGSKDFSPFLDAVCNLLQCNIAVICEEHSEHCTTALRDPYVRFYLHLPSAPNNYGITLYCKTKQSNGFYRSFSFGLPDATGTILQIYALRKILGSTGLVTKEEVSRMYMLPDARKNFIIAVLKSDLDKKFLNELYKQLPHILWQLEKAGFTTDPTKKDLDTGKNAFYYALSLVVLNDPEILYLFYKHSITMTRWDRIPPEASDVEAISNMSKVDNALRETCDSIEQNDFPTQTLNLLRELIHLNDYLLHVFSKIQVILQETDDSNNKINEAFKQREIILAVLDAYANRFNVDVFTNTEMVFERYCTYTNYFKNLDFTSAVLFFDNIFSMKKRVMLNDDWYENIESSFVHLIYTCKWYQTDAILHPINMLQQVGGTIGLTKDFYSNSLKYRLHKDWLTNTCSSEIIEENIANILQLLVYYSRLHFQPKLNYFRENIVFNITEEHLRNSDDEQRRILTYYHLITEPLIKEEMFLLRMKHYIDLAVKVNLKGDTKIGILVILRALQVFGESLHFDDKDPDPPPLAKSLLISLFSEVTLERIVELRNSLNHRKKKCLLHHLHIEKRNVLFEKIQRDLKKIQQALNPIFKIYTLRIHAFICENSLTLIEKYIHPVKTDVKVNNRVSQEKYIVRGSLEGMEQLENIILEQNFKEILSNCVLELANECAKFKNDIKTCLRNHLSWIEDNVQDENKTNKLKCRFSVMQTLVKFLAKEIDIKSEQFLNLHNSRLLDFTSVKEAKENIPKIKEYFGNYCIIELFTPKYLIDIPFHNLQIEVLFKKIDREHFIPPKQRELILSGVKEKYKERHLTLTKLICSIESKQKLSPSDLDKLVKPLDLSEKETKKIKGYYKTKNIHGLQDYCTDYYGKLKKSLVESKFDKIQHEKFRKEQIYKEGSLKIINKCLRFQYGKLDFFRDRVIQLKKLVIKRDMTIFTLWKRAKDSETLRYLEHQIVRVYMQDPELQAAVELLVSDCLNLLKDSERIQKEDQQLLQEFLLKSRRLCKEIFIRNLLAHGNPLAEVVIKLLDPGDLFREMIKEVLELIKGLPAMHALCQLREVIWEQEKGKYLNYKDFQNYLKDKSYTKIITKIKAGNRWEFYSKMLP